MNGEATSDGVHPGKDISFWLARKISGKVSVLSRRLEEEMIRKINSMKLVKKEEVKVKKEEVKVEKEEVREATEVGG